MAETNTSQFAAENMSYNTPDGKPPDHKQLMIDLIAKAHGPQAAMVADKAFKTQDKQIEEAMMDHGKTASNILESQGIDLNKLTGNFLPAKSAMQPASVKENGDIQQGGWASGFTANSTNDLMDRLVKVATIKKDSAKSLSGEVAQIKEAEKKQNAMDIADAIETGDQLADFKSLYGLAGPVKAELSRRGVDVAKLQLQATAETKLAQTLNGPQQVRLKQSIDSVLSGLDELDNLNEEFGRYGIKAFNKGQLEFLANGGGTKEQQDLAQRFKTQMIGLQDEFGNVVMGGNSPTDRALELAGKIFNSDFNNAAISGATKQMRRLLSMRKSAIDNFSTAKVQHGDKMSESTNSTDNSAPAKSYKDLLKAVGR